MSEPDITAVNVSLVVFCIIDLCEWADWALLAKN